MASPTSTHTGGSPGDPFLIELETGVGQLLSTAVPDGLSNPYSSAQDGCAAASQTIDAYTGEGNGNAFTGVQNAGSFGGEGDTAAPSLTLAYGVDTSAWPGADGTISANSDSATANTPEAPAPDLTNQAQYYQQQSQTPYDPGPAAVEPDAGPRDLTPDQMAVLVAKYAQFDVELAASQVDPVNEYHSWINDPSAWDRGPPAAGSMAISLWNGITGAAVDLLRLVIAPQTYGSPPETQPPELLDFFSGLKSTLRADYTYEEGPGPFGSRGAEEGLELLWGGVFNLGLGAGLGEWAEIPEIGEIGEATNFNTIVAETGGETLGGGGTPLMRYNFGGEGERAGFTDVNAMIGNRLSEAQIRAANPTGSFVQADIGEFLQKAPSGSASEIVAKQIPSMALGRNASTIAANMERVLAPGGTAQFTVSSPLGPAITEPFEEVGFICVGNGCRFTKPME